MLSEGHHKYDRDETQKRLNASELFKIIYNSK